MILHGRLNQTGTRLTRFSSNDPNLQNLKGEWREVLGPREGYEWWEFDYSQLESRIMAFLSKDKRLVEIYEKGIDFHLATAEAIYGKEKADDKRPQGKTTNHAKAYGGGVEAILRADPRIGRSEAERFNTAYDRAYPGIRDFGNRVSRDAARVGYVTTLYGRRLYIDEAKKAANAIDQGTAGQLAKLAMRKCRRYTHGHLDIHLVLNVHDSLVFEVWKDLVDKRYHLAHLKRLMEANEIEGLVTPVDIQLFEEDWGHGQPVSL